MKILLRLILVIVLLLVIGVFVLNWFLEKGLTPAIQKALPAVEEKLGVPIEVGNASISLFAGSMTIENVNVGNPEGFQQPSMFSLARSVQDVALLPLITKREIRIEEVTIEESDLTVVRNPDGLINLEVLLATLQGESEAPVETEEEPVDEEPPAGEEAPLPPFQLEQLFVTSLLSYVQEKKSGDPFNLGFSLEVNAENIGTIGEPTDRGTFSVSGNLAGSQELFVIRVDGEIAPIQDPLTPTFSLEGKVDSVEMQMFEVFEKDFKLKGGMMGLDMVIEAKDGVFDPDKSVVRVLIDQPDLGSGLGIPAGFQPASLAFPVRVSGTVQEPKVNFMQGLREGIQNALMTTGTGKQIQEKVDQAKAEAEAAAAEVKAKAEEASAKAKEEAEKSLESLREGKAPDVGGLLNSLGGGGDSGESDANSDSDENKEEEESGLGGLLRGL
ncbi:MAG: AsmA family protein [Verrucomicrobiota bacterium]